MRWGLKLLSSSVLGARRIQERCSPWPGPRLAGNLVGHSTGCRKCLGASQEVVSTTVGRQGGLSTVQALLGVRGPQVWTWKALPYLLRWLPGLNGAWQPGTVSRRASEKLGNQPTRARGPSTHPQGVWGPISGLASMVKPWTSGPFLAPSLILSRERSQKWSLCLSGELRNPAQSTKQGQRLARSAPLPPALL